MKACYVSIMRLPLLILGVALGSQALASGDSSDLLSDTWVATDGLGRALPGRAECGPPRSGRYVGVFYFLWLGQHGTGGPYDNTKLLAANPANPAWGPAGSYHHWGESELGYYLSNDAYVIRRHCQMLVDAGVDVIIFDVTNSFTYTTNYMLVCSTFTQIRAEGSRTPQVCFVANANSATTVQKLYTDFYSKNLYTDLWFRWLGKPLMLSSSDGLSQTVKNFFTFRQSWAWSNSAWFGTGQDKWPFLDHYPQAYGWHVPGVPEELSATVAQHATTNIGRSFHGGSQPAHNQYGLTGTQDQGLCFAEQANRVLQVDPEFLFITGWNEWVAMRFVYNPQTSVDSTFLGHTMQTGETYFVDEYTQEYSRDIEPMKGGHTDNYYYQMMSLIRRFKGVRQLEQPTAPQTIAIDGVFSEWSSVGPDYWDTIYDTTTRNSTGWGSAGTYTNTTGRNDIVRTKVAYDANYVYFYVETRANITAPTGSNWMLLFIDADHNHSTGWNGYDFLVNNTVVNSTTTTLKSNSGGGWSWTGSTNVSYAMAGNKMEVRLPRSNLGLTGSSLVFDFHWADNLQQLGTVTDFGVSGDSAPNRRANYRFSTDSGNGNVGDNVSNTIPDAMRVGFNYNCSVTMKNSGSQTWSCFPAGTMLTVGQFNGPAVCKLIPFPYLQIYTDPCVVPVAQNSTFPFTLSIPGDSPLGTYEISWQMKDNTEFFDSTGHNAIFRKNVYIHDNFSQFVSDTIPSSMSPGQSYNCSISMRNAGSQTWSCSPAGTVLTVGQFNGLEACKLIPYPYSEIATNPCVINPSQQCTFPFTISVPADTQAGSYEIKWEMKDNGCWFGQSFTKNVTVNNSVPPAISTAVSRKTHSGAGSFDINIKSAGAVEPRSGGPTTLIVTFDNAIERINNTLADVFVLSGSVSGLSASGSQLTVTMSGANNGPDLITFPGIRGAGGGALITGTLCFVVLPGDVTGDRTVDVLDLVSARNQLNQSVTSGNARTDVTVDGAINIFDLVSIRNTLNTSAAGCP